VSAGGVVLLRLLAEWRALSRDEREQNEGTIVMASESYLAGQSFFATSYNAWWDVASLAAPLPVPFVCYRGQA
jgi:hypothetical protein